MLTTIRPQTPQFAGKDKKTNINKKAIILGSLLASAGSVSALPNGHNGVSVKGSLNSTAGDSFVYLPKAASSEEKPGILHKLLGRDSQTEDANEAKAREILKNPAFRPTDINLFNPSIYPDANPMQLAPVENVDEDKIREELLDVLTKRFKGDADKAKKAVAEVFDDKGVKKTMPDPVLRAALTNLEGTTGRSAIDVIKNGTYKTVDFSQIYPSKTSLYDIDPKKAIAVTHILPEMNVTFNNRYQGENFQLLSQTMAHETLHQDDITYHSEEFVNDALTSTAHGQLVLQNPKLAQGDTELSRRLNSLLMTRINGRDENGNLRIFKANGTTTPGGVEVKDFAAFYSIPSLQMMGPSSPGNANLKAMLKAVTGKDVDNPDFDQKTLALLDENQAALKPSEIVELARILKLNVPSDGTSTGTNGTDGNTDGTDDRPAPCSSEQNAPGCGQTSGSERSASVPKKLLMGLGLGVPAALLGLS